MGIRGADSTQLFELSYSFPHSHIRGKVMALFQLIYMSTLATDEPDILHGILDSSVRNNPRKNITGMMLYSEGSVLQVLEGEKDDVLELFRVIERDVRHSGIYLLIESEISTRNFPPGAWGSGGCPRRTWPNSPPPHKSSKPVPTNSRCAFNLARRSSF